MADSRPAAADRTEWTAGGRPVRCVPESELLDMFGVALLFVVLIAFVVYEALKKAGTK